MKIKNRILVLGSVIVGLLTSCSGDFLQIEPASQITPEQYLWEASQLSSYSINMYSILPSHVNWTEGTFGIDVHTDNMASMGYSNKFVPGQFKVSQTGGYWEFTNIYKCNYFLNTVVPRWKANAISGDADNIKDYIGEMYFFRAYSYFEKVKALGDFPIIKKTLPDNMQILTDASKRVPHPDVVRFILSDLDSAIVLLKTSSPDGAKNRLSKACAQLFKSRVALYEATWLKYFKNTAFVPNGPNWPGAGKDYNKSWQYQSGSIDKEIDWLLDQSMTSAQAVADAFALTPNNKSLQQSTSDPANPYFDMFGAFDMSGYSEVLLWKKYDKGLNIVNNISLYGTLGNYGVGLTRGLVDGFLMANGLPIYAANSGYQGDDQISNVREARDGRLWLFLKEPGQVNVLYPFAGSAASDKETVPDILNSNEAQGYSTGYSFRKGLNYNAATDVNGLGYIGCIMYRATEAYLNYIEACYEKNHSLDAKAQDYWMKIRNRAGVDPDYAKTIAATDLDQEAKNDWAVYSGGTKVDATLYNIRRERRCELMAEGLRDMDLNRWRAKDQMIDVPYHIEGFKLWGSMQYWYTKLTYGTSTSNVSDPSRSLYLRPYEKTGKELVYNGYRWAMAHYWNPIAIQHFLITSENNDLATSPIYQNPGWSLVANSGAIGY